MYALAVLVVALVFGTPHVTTAVDMAEIQRREAEDAKADARIREAKSWRSSYTISRPKNEQATLGPSSTPGTGLRNPFAVTPALPSSATFWLTSGDQ
jgi:hypothetical protein